MIKLIRNSLFIIPLFFSLQALALGLQAAKTEGLVGEQADGYLGIVADSSPEVVDLVKDINNKRRAAYQRIADKNGTELKAVEQLAGQKAISKTARGNYIKQRSGGWEKVN